MMFNDILCELAAHHRDRKTILKSSVEKRLNKSLMTYYKSIDSSLTYLSNKSTKKVADAINEDD